MSVFFRVDASPSMGTGHLMRCLALAQALDEQMIDVCFFIREQSRENCLSRHDWVGQIHIIPDAIPIADEPQWLNEQVGQHRPSLLILDGYQFHATYRAALQAKLQDLHIPLVLFDDTNSDLTNGLLYADVIINSAPDAVTLNYQATAPGATYCLGTEFRVLRQEFYVQQPVSWQNRNSLTLVMGGSDVNNLTIPLLQQLDKQGFSDPVRVLTGSAYPHIEALQHTIAVSSLAIQHIANCQTVAEVFSHSKLIVSAAGASQFEILACGTPAVLAVIADNQLGASHSAEQQGWCAVADCRDSHIKENADIQMLALAKQVIALWQDDSSLQSFYQAAQRQQAAQLDSRFSLIEALFPGD